MQKVNLTCIVCPIGCRMEATRADDGTITEVTGNTCPRGKKYALSELTNPVRTLTSTIRIEGAAEEFLPVKTDAPIPKGKLFDAMKELRGITAKAPVTMGDVLAENFIAEGVNLVACKTIEAK